MVPRRGGGPALMALPWRSMITRKEGICGLSPEITEPACALDWITVAPDLPAGFLERVRWAGAQPSLPLGPIVCERWLAVHQFQHRLPTTQHLKTDPQSGKGGRCTLGRS